VEELNRITEKVIGCAIEVHRNLGPGLLESLYEAALAIELEAAGLAVARQVPLQVRYKGRTSASTASTCSSMIGWSWRSRA